MPQLTVDAERCAHQRIADSRCRACVDACPHNAWQLHPDGLGFDTDACDDCGQCVAACPLEAIALPAPLPAVADTRPRALLLACEHAGLPDRAPGAPRAAGRVRCLHGLSPDLLMEWSTRHRAEVLRVATGDCTRCERGPRDTQADLAHRWQQLSGHAALHGQQLPRWQATTATQWQALARQTDQPDPGRRRFFGAVVPSSSPGGPSLVAGPTPHTSGRTRLVRQLQPAESTQAPAPLWWVAVDPNRCTACMACQAICPAEAFCLHPPQHTDVTTNSADQDWTMEMNRCTGCGLCIDLCDSHALTLHGPGTPRPGPPQRVRLHSRDCPSCRVRFLTPHRTTPHSPTEVAGRCPACQRGRLPRADRVVQTRPYP